MTTFITEQQMQEAVQDVVQALSSFHKDAVVINDWNVLDISNDFAPFVIIINSDQVSVNPSDRFHAMTSEVRLLLVVPMGTQDWSTVYNIFRNYRQELIQGLNEAPTMGLDGLMISRISNESSIGYIFPPGIDPDGVADAIPDYITQYFSISFMQF